MLYPVVDSLLYIFNTVIGLYELVVILAVIASWLVPMGVLSPRNDMVRSLLNLLDALTEPVLRPIRRLLPSVAGIDFSPIVLLVGLEVIKRLVNGYAVYLYR
ncbi:MAG: YggT family protein [Alphaproteobacteria bacterium]|nr:YggT family protein [Alphaproteobacteria bacterium]MBV9693416.1 YggT family protein [Alphaproteobacteria bacterium]